MKPTIKQYKKKKNSSKDNPFKIRGKTMAKIENYIDIFTNLRSFMCSKNVVFLFRLICYVLLSPVMAYLFPSLMY